jgi:hypothetical protein
MKRLSASAKSISAQRRCLQSGLYCVAEELTADASMQNGGRCSELAHPRLGTALELAIGRAMSAKDHLFPSPDATLDMLLIRKRRPQRLAEHYCAAAEPRNIALQRRVWREPWIIVQG